MNNQSDNQSYSLSPTIDTEPEAGKEEAHFIPDGRSVPIGNIITWISDSWEIFKQRTWLWIGFVLLYTLLGFPLKHIHFFFAIILIFVNFLLSAGVLYSCDLLRRKGSFTFGDFFAAFRSRTGSLLLLYLLALGFLILLLLIPALFLIDGSGTGISPGMIIAGAVILVGWVLYCMASWFTPTLVMIHGLPPFKAIRMSFSACLKNILLAIVLSLGAAIVMGITFLAYGGLLVTILSCFIFICAYVSYRDIFFDKDN